MCIKIVTTLPFMRMQVFTVKLNKGKVKSFFFLISDRLGTQDQELIAPSVS